MASKNFCGALLRNFSFAALLLLAFAFAASANSVDNFVYQSAGNTYTWSLDSTLTPDSGVVFPGWGFGPIDVTVYKNGSLVQSPTTLVFYNSFCSGGFDLQIGNTYLASTTDVQLYQGPEFMPTFLLGTFGLTDWTDLVNGNSLAADYATGNNASITISAVPAPEPSALALLFVGLAAISLIALKKIAL